MQGEARISEGSVLKRFPNNLRDLRQAYKKQDRKKWTQREVGLALGLTRGTYSIIESGIIYPTKPYRVKITNLFGVLEEDIWLSILEPLS